MGGEEGKFGHLRHWSKDVKTVAPIDLSHLQGAEHWLVGLQVQAKETSTLARVLVVRNSTEAKRDHLSY